MANGEKVTYIGETDFRNRKVRFGIKNKDRTKHVYVIGKTGMGKSTLLENMAVQDIVNGEGLSFIDPHGKSADLLLDYIPESRIKDVMYFAPFDSDYPIPFNVMEDVGYDKRHLVVSGLMSAFKKIWVDAWSARMEYILNNTLLALLEYPDSTLLSVNRMLSDKNYRNLVVSKVTDPSVRSFWTDEFAKYTDRFAAEATPAIQNKVGQFISNPVIRNIIGQPHSTFDFRKMMDEKKIVIINLSKGRVGETNANLIGSMLITKIYLSAMSRADVSETVMRTLPDFYLYVDEFQSFANESFADILSEARKYKLSLTLAHQYIEQMSEEVQAAVFGNVGTTLSFRVGPLDAELLEKIFSPKFMIEDLVNLGFAQVYMTLMIDGVGSPPFSARTLPPIPLQATSFRDQVIEHSRKTYSRPRATVEEEVRVWHEPVRKPMTSPRPVSTGQASDKRPSLDSPRRGGQETSGPRQETRPPARAPQDFNFRPPPGKQAPPRQTFDSPAQISSKFSAGKQNLVGQAPRSPQQPTQQQSPRREQLQPQRPQQNQQPQKTHKPLAGLKDLISQAMAEPKRQETSNKRQEEQKKELKPNSPLSPSTSNLESIQKEIPEDELRKMLDV